jgi:hypothetical protein
MMPHWLIIAIIKLVLHISSQNTCHSCINNQLMHYYIVVCLLIMCPIGFGSHLFKIHSLNYSTVLAPLQWNMPGKRYFWSKRLLRFSFYYNQWNIMFGTYVTSLLNFNENKCSYHMLTLIKRGWLYVLHYFFRIRESVKDLARISKYHIRSKRILSLSWNW